MPHTQNPIMQKRYINAKELSEYLSLPIGSLYQMTSRKQIPYVKIGRLLKFDIKDLDKWLEKKKVKPHKIWDEIYKE